MDRELILLKIRSLVAEKEMVRARADKELSDGGWTIDYSTWHQEIEFELQKLFGQLEKGGE